MSTLVYYNLDNLELPISTPIQVRRYYSTVAFQVCYKFIRTPTSHGHVEFPTWKFSNVFFVLPPTTHRPTGSSTVSICSNGLNASMALLMQPHLHLHYLQSPQVQSLTLNPTSLLSLVDAAIATLPPPPPQPCTSELEVHRASSSMWLL